MTGDVDTIHHIGVVANSFPDLTATYERLGFGLTPLSVPLIQLSADSEPVAIGAGNRCAIFENGYLELLGIVDAIRWNEVTPEQRGPFDLDRVLARHEGLHVLHLGSGNLDRTRERLAAERLEPSPIRPFRREVDTPSGSRTMRARSLSFPPGSMPEALVQIAQHETPELVLQPRYMDHPNGARLLTGVVICAVDAAEVAARYARCAGTQVRRDGERHVVDVGAARIIVVAPAMLEWTMPNRTIGAPPFLAGFIVGGELARARAFLAATDVPVDDTPEGLFVPAQSACGATIMFEAR